MTPPLYATDSVLKTWLSKYGANAGAKRIMNQGHLELQKGKRIREDAHANTLDAESLVKWLRNTENVLVDKWTCQAWLQKKHDWSTAGKYATPEAVEEARGKTLPRPV